MIVFNNLFDGVVNNYIEVVNNYAEVVNNLNVVVFALGYSCGSNAMAPVRW